MIEEKNLNLPEEDDDDLNLPDTELGDDLKEQEGAAETEEVKDDEDLGDDF